MILNSIEAGTGPAILLLHGLFGAAKNLGAIARALSAQARVISLDMRNHGASGHDADMGYGVMAADVAETMAGMGVGQAVVIGHSMGGKTAMTLALTRPDLVAKLAVLDIAPVAYQHGYGDFVAGMRAMRLTPDLTRGQADAALAAAVPEPAYRSFLLNNLILGEAPHWRLGLDEIEGAMPALVGWEDVPGARYEGNALFMRGAKSDYVTDAARETILALFPRAVFETIEGAGHWLHAERPAAVIGGLERFLAA